MYLLACSGKGWRADGPTDKPEQVQCSACQGAGQICLHPKWEGIPEVDAHCVVCGIDEIGAANEREARFLMLTPEERTDLLERMQRVMNSGNDGADIEEYESAANHYIEKYGEEVVRQFENEMTLMLK